MTFDEIEKVVGQSLLDYIRRYEFERVKREKINSEKINELKIELVKIQEEITHLMEKVAGANDVLFSYINTRIAQLDEERKNIERAMSDEKARQKNEAAPEYIRKALNDWEEMSFDEKKAIANVFIEKVVIYNGEIDIAFK